MLSLAGEPILGRASTMLFRVGAAAALVHGADLKDLLKRRLPQKLDAGVWVMQPGSWGGVYCMGQDLTNERRDRLLPLFLLMEYVNKQWALYGLSGEVPLEL